MKTLFLSLVGTDLLLAPLATAFAQSTWETVDDFHLAPGHGVAIAGIAAADAGVVFSACMGSDAAGCPHGFIRRSLDGGQTWLNVLDLPGTGSTTCFSTAVTPSGLVFTTGDINATNWAAARSSDGGTTWTTVADLAGGVLGDWGMTATPAGGLRAQHLFGTGHAGVTDGVPVPGTGDSLAVRITVGGQRHSHKDMNAWRGHSHLFAKRRFEEKGATVQETEEAAPQTLFA
jgi:hypothetical protein